MEVRSVNVKKTKKFNKNHPENYHVHDSDIGVVKGHQMFVIKIELESYQRRSDESPKGGALRQFPCCR